MRHSETRTKISVALVGSLLCFGVVDRDTFAQGRTYSVARRIEKIENQADQYERDGLHRDREDKATTGADRKRARAIASQVTEDFERIQVIYNDLVRTLAAGKTLESAALAESITGINRCAGRLKANLALPEVKDKDKNHLAPEVSSERLTSSVTVLLNRISSFVTNPLFESTGVLDLELSTKASSDLNEVIELSNSIKKSLERMKP